MEITFVGRTLTREGGSSFSLDLTAQLLADHGHDVQILTLSDLNKNPNLDRDYDVESVDVSGYRTRIGKSKGIAEVLENYSSSTDIYHLYTPSFASGGGRYRQEEGEVPVVTRLNNYDLFCTNLSRIDGSCHQNCHVMEKFQHSTNTLQRDLVKTPLYMYSTYIEPRLLNAVDAYIALSPAVKEIYSNIGVSSERIHTLPNFYDPSFSESASPKQPLEKLESGIDLLYTGRLESQKGVDVLVNAANRIRERGKRVAIHVVGNGGQKQQLKRLSRELGISEHTMFYGWVEYSELSSFYCSADAFVHPGRWPEPFGRTILEAMQCGCLPVVSDIGGPPWIVDDDDLTFPVDDPDALAGRVETIFEESRSGERTNKKEQCRSRVEDFAPERLIEQLQDIYQNIEQSGGALVSHNT